MQKCRAHHSHSDGPVQTSSPARSSFGALAGWGWALWNFRGGFGILDSDRPDVVYEDWKGHKLGRRMLQLLQRY